MKRANARTVSRRKEKDYAPTLYDAATEAAHRLTVAIHLLYAHESGHFRDTGGYDIATAIDVLGTAQDLLQRSAAEALRQEREAEPGTERR